MSTIFPGLDGLPGAPVHGAEAAALTSEALSAGCRDHQRGDASLMSTVFTALARCAMKSIAATEDVAVAWSA